MTQGRSSASQTGGANVDVERGKVRVRGMELSYPTGGELLAAYWGYLSDGGLVVEDESLRPGELVSLRVTIAGQPPEETISGKVLRCRSDGWAVVGFEPGQPQDMLLSRALADAENVPARRHRRYAVDLEARVQNGSAAAAATILNVSASGCCLRVPEAERESFSPGDRVSLSAGALSASGSVVWAKNTERGVEYSEEPHGVLTWVRAYLDRLRLP